MDINFFEDVVDRRDAEALLIGKDGGTYLTWRATDAAYYLSYMSANSRQVTHIDITRDPNGEFYLTKGLEQKRYPDLGSLLQERGYISKPVRTGPNGGSAVEGSEASSPTIRQTTAGKSKAQAAKSSLPAYIEPPKPKANDQNEADDDFLDSNKYSRGIQPSVSPPILYAVFGTCASIAASAVAACWMQKKSAESDALSTASDMYRVTSSAVQGASLTLFDRLHAMDAGAIPDDGPTLEQQCLSAAQDWKTELEPIVPVLQHMYDSAHITAYLSTLVYSVLACALVALSLGCIHTGRARKRYTPTEQEFMASGPSAGREPLCTQLQSAWSGAWLSLIAAALLCGSWLMTALWELGASATSLQYAAQTLSTMFPSDVRAQTGSASNVRSLYATALERGMWGSVSILAGVPASCLVAMQPVIADVLEMPALVRMGSVPAWVKVALSPVLRPSPAGATSALASHDPVAWPAAIKGWIDETGSTGAGLAGRVMQWVMPSQKAVAISILNCVAIFMGASIFILLAQEWVVGEVMPAYRRWKKTGQWSLEKAVQARLANKTTSIKVAGKDD